MPGEEATDRVAKQPTPAAARSRKPSLPPPRRDGPDDDEYNEYDNAPPRRSGKPLSLGESNAAAHSLGIGAMVLGVVALPFSLIPCVGLLSLPLSGIGVLLGVAGLAVSIGRQGRGIGFPIAGTAVSSLALLFGVLWWYAGVSAREGIQAAAKTVRENKEAEGKADADPVSWQDASSPIRRDSVQITVDRVRVGKVATTDDGQSRNELLTIRLVVRNISATRKVDFVTWRAVTFLPSGDASVEDTFGNKYDGVRTNWIPQGHDGSKTLHPGDESRDVLVFERPLRNVEALRLKLPASAFDKGSKDMIRLAIPASMIKWE